MRVSKSTGGTVSMVHNAIINPVIEEYCKRMSTSPSRYCEDIFNHTVEHHEDSQMLIGPLEAGFLGLLVDMIGARRVLEIGCYTGYSALAMAERLPPDGELFTIDHDIKTAETAKEFWSKSPGGSVITLLPGSALDVLEGISGTFDLVFIDADKENYIRYLDRTLPMLSEKGIVIADNTLWYGKVTDPDTDDPDAAAIRAFNEYVRNRNDLAATLLPMRDGVTLIRPVFVQ